MTSDPVGVQRLFPTIFLVASCARAPLGMLDENQPSFRPRLPAATSLLRVAEAPAPDAAGSLSLAAAYQLALTRSQRVAITTQQIESERLVRRTARDEFLPTATVSASGVLRRERVAENTVIQTSQQALVEGRIAQPLFRRGLFSTLEAGDEAMQAARETNAREQETLARDVASAFIDVLRTRKLIELADVATVRAQEQLDKAIARAKSGNALRNAELQARVDIKRAAQQTVTAKRDALIAAALFSRIVGRAPPAQLVLPAEPAVPAPEQALLQVRQRADVRSLERRVAVASALTEAAHAARWWPRVDVVGTVQYYTPQVFNRNFEWNLLGTVTIPLFEAAQHTELAIRQNEARLAELEYRSQLQLIDEEVSAAAARVASSQEAQKLAGEELEAARELYGLVDKQLKLGAVTYLETTNAQAVLAEAENSFEIIRMERVASVYDYLYVIGGLDLGPAK